MAREIRVAIDFGTTFTAVAWAQTAQPDITNLITQWPDQSGSLEGESSDQVPTQLAYEGDKCLWGFQIPDDKRRYELFKLGLNPAGSTKHSFLSLKYPSPRTIQPDLETTASKLTTDFLRELHTHILRTLRSKLGNGLVSSTSIRYTLTVPAIWNDAAKALTVKCANDCGMGEDVTLLAEPEAAATYALATRDHAMNAGDSFVIADAGGGTADLISYMIVNTERPVTLQEVVPGSGDPLGSSYLDRIFREWFEKCFKHLKEWDDEILEEAMSKFESSTKRKFSGAEQWLNIPVHGLPDNPDKNVKRGMLRMSNADLRSIFDMVVSGVTGHVSMQIQRTVNPKAVLLVGGFGENAYLREMVRKVVGHEVEVIQPPNAWTCIVRGALLKALAESDPKSARIKVDGRAARKSYGIRVARPFDHKNHPWHLRYWGSYYGNYRILLNSWEVKEGSIIRESEPLILNYTRIMDIRHGPFVSCINAIYSHNNNGKAPPALPDEKLLVRLSADLSAIPREEFPIKIGADGKQYYLLHYEIRAHFYSALTEWSLWFKNKCYGKVNAEYA